MYKLRTMCVVLLTAALFMTGTGRVAAEIVFRDIDNHWAKTTIEWGVSKGIVNGYANGTFMPNQNVTEAEFIRMLVIGLTGKDLEDGYISERWSDKYYNHLHFMNYPLDGYTDLPLRNTFIKRTQVAELVASADGVNYSGNQAIQYVMGKKYATGRIEGEYSIKSYMGHETITRAEVLQLIKNLVDRGMSHLYERPLTPSPEARLPELPTAWDLYRDEMHMVIRQKIFANLDGYRIYDDGLNKIVMTKTKQEGLMDNAVSVQFEQQIQSFSAVSISDINDKTQRNLLIDILNLYGFKADDAFLKKVDEVKKNKKEAQLLLSGKMIVIDPMITSPDGHVTVYYKWWDAPRS